MSTPVPKTSPLSRPLSDDPGSGGPKPSRSACGTLHFPPPLWGREGRGVVRRELCASPQPPPPLTPPHKGEGNKQIRKGSRTPKGARSSNRTCKVRRASGGTRTPSGVPLRLMPKGLLIPRAQPRPSFLGLGESLRAYGPRQPGRVSQASPRALPAPACPSPVSTSRAGPSAGRLMPKPPERGSDKPPLAGTALAPPAEVTRPASFR
jgi:hypothetical protein